MTNDYRNVFGRLRSIRPAPHRPGTWMARCPLHEDRRPSLSVWLGRDGKLLLRCWSCRSPVERIVEGLGLSVADLFPANSRRRVAVQNSRIVATYDYYSAAGELAYQVARFEPKDFRQRRPNPAGGWIWNLEGVERVLYRMPQIAEHTRGERSPWVWVVEGEKDADALWDLGLVATTNAGGAGKWQDSYSQVLAGLRVAIIPDRDEPGRQHALQVAGSLVWHGAAAIRIVQLDGAGKDVSDWLARWPADSPARLSRRGLYELLAYAPAWVRFPRGKDVYGEDRGEAPEAEDSSGQVCGHAAHRQDAQAAAPA